MWRLVLFAVIVAAPGAGAQAPGEPAVEQALLNGYRRYNGTCGHCHGPDGGGSSFGPSLILEPLPFARFQEIVRNGSASGSFVMRGFALDPNVAPHVQDIWLYLRARADGTIGRGRPKLQP
jgi:mono/diheme cytochrome c family protein